MGEEKPETLDFVKDFQEYLSQQTQHVNMISGSVIGVKEGDEIQGDLGQNGLEHPAVDISLEDSSGMLVDGFERTYDGKLKCRYCNYATRGTARLIEHIRIHTGEKPHRCHLCPFASAYERHLEAHMRSHTGEKPYKCELCSFRCSDRSNLSHHRRRRHKLLPMKGARSSLSHRKMLSVLQKRGSSLGYGRRLLINLSPPSMVLQKPGSEQHHLGDFSHDLPSHAHLHQEVYNGLGKDPQASGSMGGCSREHEDMVLDNPLNQLSTLAGQLASIPPEAHGAPVSPGAESLPDEKPTFLVQQPVMAPAAVSVSAAQASSPITPEPRPAAHSGCSPGVGPCSERTSTPSGTNSQPGTPTRVQDPQMLHHCPHCHIYFPDNILYTIHMGCHGYEHPFQCNICGHRCRNSYDFACHFARGQHKQ
ncbi:Zinc finger protein [Triplophysa tibetana]|uniref:Zinc finger protein Pegasus n=1 Tax=Triplophysa tibetana TaxID=1572043 RepID=A0A5A9NS88_9TELE|nr:Zinc finger protein [Triplophysa tibetana]